MPEAAYPELMGTPLFDDSDEHFLSRRSRLIEEALGWGDGWHEVDRLEGGLVVGFKKPGRDSRKFQHDMTPTLRQNNSEQEPWQMRDVWAQLCMVGMVDREAFKALLVLIYRNAYLIDHAEDRLGRLRYRPPKPAISRLENMLKKRGGEERVREILPCGVLGLLHFLNLLGWNEDMRYNVEWGKPSFAKGRYARGRVKTLLTCIRTSVEVVRFTERVRCGDVDKDTIGSLLGIMQSLINAKGLCPPNKQQLVGWLEPYLTGRPPSMEDWMA